MSQYPQRNMSMLKRARRSSNL